MGSRWLCSVGGGTSKLKGPLHHVDDDHDISTQREKNLLIIFIQPNYIHLPPTFLQWFNSTPTQSCKPAKVCSSVRGSLYAFRLMDGALLSWCCWCDLSLDRILRCPSVLKSILCSFLGPTEQSSDRNGDLLFATASQQVHRRRARESLMASQILPPQRPLSSAKLFYFHIKVTNTPLPPLEEDAKVYCQKLTENISKVADIPIVCNKFPDVVKSMKSRIDEKDAAIATQGMRAGSGNEARMARSKGTLYQAQVTRRYTQTRRFSNKKASY
jgi:hypothetical protein